MFVCSIAVFTLTSAAYFVYRLRQFQKWKSESELYNQMEKEVEQMKQMVSDILLEADREARKKRGGRD